MDFVEKPIWKNRSLIARIEAVEKLTDRNLLADIAKTDSDEDVRRKAVGKLTDQNLLADIAKNESGRKLGFPSAFFSVAPKVGINARARILAIKKLTNQNILADIAKTVSDEEVREAAFGKLTDQKLILDIARNYSDQLVCCMAVEKLIDQKTLADIAKSHPDQLARCMAVEKMIDQNILADIAKNDSCLKPARSIRFAGFMISDEYVRTLAIKKLTGQNILADIAKNESNGHIRKAAVEKLNGLISKPIPMTDNSYSHMNGYKITSRTIQFRESSKFSRTIFNPELFIIKNDKEKAAFNNLMHELSSTRRECTNPIAENVDYPYFVIEGDAIECGIRYGMWYTYGSDAHKLAMHIVLSDMTDD